MLKKVQMPPALFLGIIRFYTRLPTLRAGKGASPGKVDPYVESLCIGVKLCIRHLPGRCQTKGHLKKVYVSHNENRNIIFAVVKSRLTHLKQRGTFTSLEDQILDAVERYPSAAILLAWSALETAIASAVARLGISPEPPSYRSPMHNIEMLSKYGGLSKNHEQLLNEMRILRNKVAHEMESLMTITQEQALNYANAALDMIKYLEQLKRNT